jgi:hypothetical protein
MGKCSCDITAGAPVARSPILRAGCLTALTLLGGAGLFLPAPAGAAKPPKYSLSIVEGETTLPEYSVAHTSAGVEPDAEAVLSITRNGTVVARDSGDHGAWLSQVPQVGDLVSLESPIGDTVGSFVYDGLPSMDPTVCSGSASFSGQNSSGQIVHGGYYTEEANPPYSPERTGYGRAQVTMLSGTTFGGSFLSPLAIGQTVYALESLETPLAGGAVFEYSSETVRPVGACPAPPPSAPPPPPPPALMGSIFKLGKITLHKLLKSGWLTEVTINQPGTVTVDLYERNGRLPAFASSTHRNKKHHKRRKRRALLLARGTASAHSAGTVKVRLHVTAIGRRALRHRHRKISALLITTLRSSSGARLTLARHPLSLRP